MNEIDQDSVDKISCGKALDDIMQNPLFLDLRLPLIRTMTSLGAFKQAPHKFFVPLHLSIAYLLIRLISRLLA